MDLLVAPAIILVPLAAWYLTVWVHELGHVIAGRTAGIAVHSAGTGTGGWVACARVGGVRLYAATRNPFQGITFAEQGLIPHRGRVAVLYAGGIVANTVVAAVTFAAVGPVPPPNWWASAWLFGVLNAVAAISSLVPFSFRVGSATLRTDAALILVLLTGRFPDPSFSDGPNAVRVFGPLWRSVGDRQTPATFLALSARNWAEMRNPERAADLLAEAERSLDRPSEVIGLLADLTRVWLAVAEGRAADSDLAANAAAARVARPGGERVRLAVEIDRAESRVRLGDLAGARAILDGMSAEPLVASDPALRWGFRALAYRVGMTDDPPPGPPDDGPANRIWHLSALAGRAAADGNWAAVERLARAGVVEIERLSAELADPADRAALDSLRVEFRERVRQAVAEQGRDPAAEPPPAMSAPPDPAVLRSERLKWLLAATILTALGGSVVWAALAFGPIARGPHDGKWWGVTLIFYAMSGGVFGLAAGLFTVGTAAIRWQNPSRMPNFGSRSLSYAVMAFTLPVFVAAGVWLAAPKP
jgi:hypothetical protein